MMETSLQGRNKRKELLDTINSLNASISKISETMKKRAVVEKTVKGAADHGSTLQQLKERIDNLCSKPQISIAELDEMFMTKSEKEKIKGMDIKKMESDVAESITQRTVDVIKEDEQQKHAFVPPMPALPKKIEVPKGIQLQPPRLGPEQPATPKPATQPSLVTPEPAAQPVQQPKAQSFLPKIPKELELEAPKPELPELRQEPPRQGPPPTTPVPPAPRSDIPVPRPLPPEAPKPPAAFTEPPVPKPSIVTKPQQKLKIPVPVPRKEPVAAPVVAPPAPQKQGKPPAADAGRKEKNELKDLLGQLQASLNS